MTIADLLTPQQFCNEFGAFATGAEFALKYTTMAEVWDNCPNISWLRRIGTKLGADVTYSTSRSFACWRIRNIPIPDGRTIWDLLSDSRSRDAVVAAEGFVAGTVTAGQLAKAESAGIAAAFTFDRTRGIHASAAVASLAVASLAAARVAASHLNCFGVGIHEAVYATAMTIPCTLNVALEAANAAELAQFHRMIPNPFTQYTNGQWHAPLAVKMSEIIHEAKV